MAERALPAVTAEEQAEMVRETIANLEERLRSTPKDHRKERAMLKYNLGLAYSESPTGDRAINLSRAVAALKSATQMFDRETEPIEFARSHNALGATLREMGQVEEAAASFRIAAQIFSKDVAPGEHGAAMNNLGLALGDGGYREDAIEAFRTSLEAFDDPSFERQRISVLNNLGQVLASSPDPAEIREGIAAYEAALEIADPEEHPYQWAMVHHSLGVAYTAISEPQAAAEEFRQALRVFTRYRFPFQYALAKNNLGLAFAQIGGVDPLRRAVAAYEDALRVLDMRLHRPQWEQAYHNLQLAEVALVEAGEPGTRAEHFVRLAASMDNDELMTSFRERVGDLTMLPEPRRTDALGEFSNAMLSLDDAAAVKLTAAWLNVLMELPHDRFLVGLRARMLVHEALEPGAAERAAAILDRTIQEELLAPQRIRVRDTLYELGFERPG